MNRVKAVIFDCDGVMFDSRGANEAYYNQILKRFDMKEMDADESDFTHMHTVEESIAHIFRDAPGLVGPAHGYRRDMSYIPFIAHMKMHPYLITFLQYLRPAYKTAFSHPETNNACARHKNRNHQYNSLERNRKNHAGTKTDSRARSCA